MRIVIALVVLGLFGAPGPSWATGSDALRDAALDGMGPRVQQARAGHYQVTAGPAGELAEGTAARLAGLLLAFDGAYRRMWQGQTQGAGPVEDVSVYVFSRPGIMDRALDAAGVSRPPFETGGAYLPSLRALAVASESRLDRVLEGSLLHEAAHLLNREFLGDAPSPWLNEGLAQYCQYSAITDTGEVRLGEVAEGAELRVPQGDTELIYQFVPKRSLSYLLGQFMRDPRLSLGPLLDIRSAPAFYRQEAQLHYASSWTLVHLLAEGRIRRLGPLRPYFFRYVALDRRGDGGREALLDVLGIPLEDLDYAWYRHVKKLR